MGWGGPCTSGTCFAGHNLLTKLYRTLILAWSYLVFSIDVHRRGTRFEILLIFLKHWFMKTHFVVKGQATQALGLIILTSFSPSATIQWVHGEKYVPPEGSTKRTKVQGEDGGFAEVLLEQCGKQVGLCKGWPRLSRLTTPLTARPIFFIMSLGSLPGSTRLRQPWLCQLWSPVKGLRKTRHL